MNTIEQAAKRIEELRRSGVDVPWSAAGLEAPSGVATNVPPVSTPSTSAPAVMSMPATAAPDAAPAATPEAAATVARHIDPSRPVRRSREVELDFRRLQADGFLVPGTERSQMEEEFRIVKRPLLKNAAGESAAPVSRANLIMVTSALPGEGKTFTAINLAMSMAMELDHTVLLVDADVVRPSVLERLYLPPSKGLLDVLMEPQKDLSDVLLKTNIPKLSILPAGTSTHRTTELLASGAMEDLLDELATLYHDRIVIFDAPPLLPSTESRVLATHMGQVVVVVEADSTTQTTVARAFDTLEACPVVMAVLNKSRSKVANSAYGYYSV
jgi:receptor protein-tyrosine kinase